jgi:hypothetical protein
MADCLFESIELKSGWMALLIIGVYHKDLWKSINRVRKVRKVYQICRQLTQGRAAPESRCVVCLEGLQEGVSLNCGHSFHYDCLRLWLVSA